MYDLRQRAALRELDVASISPRNSVRMELGNIEELAGDINERGLAYPLIVRTIELNRYKPLDGDRRLAAVVFLRWKKVSAFVHEQMSEVEAYEYTLAVNIHNKTLSPLEEARAFQHYVKEAGWGGMTQLAQQIGKTVEYVSERMKLLELPQEVQRRISPYGESSISVSAAEELAALATEKRDPESLTKVADMVSDLELNVDEVRTIVQDEKNGGPLLKLVDRIEDRHRKKRFVMLLRREKTMTWSEGERIVKLLRDDVYLDPWSALDQVRSVTAPERQLFTITIEDSRILGATKLAAEASGRSPEEYIVDKLVEGLVNDGYLKPEVITQLKVKDYVEQTLSRKR